MQGRAAHRRRLALLALLATAPGGSLARERIIAFLWPESEPEKARRLLAESVYVIRKDLADAAVVSIGDELRLATDLVGSDVGQFRAALAQGELERAAALQAAPFLDGWFVADAPEFDRWAEAERARLSRELATVLRTLAERQELADDAAGALEHWRRLAALEPYSSAHALASARCLVRLGERAAALRLLRDHEAVLRADLEVDADAEVLELAKALRTPSAPARTTPPAPSDAVHVGSRRSHAAGDDAVHEGAPFAVADQSALSPPRADHSEHPSGSAVSRRRIAVALAALVIAGSAMALVPQALRRAGGEVARPRLDPNRIAVLFFEDHSPGRDLGPIASELTTQLIDELSGLSALRVVSRNGVRPFRDVAVAPESIGRALDAAYLVEGSVRRAGTELQVHVQLIDAASATVLESRSLRGPVADLFEIERDVAREVASALRRRVGAVLRVREDAAEHVSGIARKLVVLADRELDQGDSLARARDAADVASAEHAYERADSLFARATTEEPGWPRAWIGRAVVARRLGRLSSGAARVHHFRSGVAWADSALRHDPDDARALEARGALRWGIVTALGAGAGDAIMLREAEHDLRAAVSRDSARAGAWATLSYVLSLRGAFAESRLAAERALREDAWLEEARDVTFQLYGSALMLGDLADAARWCRHGRERQPGAWEFVECELTLMREDVRAGPDPERAWRLVQRLDSLDPAATARQAGRAYAPVYRRMLAAAISARAGDAARARVEVARARTAVQGDEALRLDLAFEEAYVRQALGERDTAEALLRELLASRPVLRPQLQRDPLLGELVTRLSDPAPRP